MSTYTLALIFGALAIPALLGMWFAWRARARRDEALLGDTAAITGEMIERFPRASYVSTTPLGAPFERVALPGLRYKGNAELAIHQDGVIIAVTGESPVRIPAVSIVGSDTAGGRIGKAVERDGLSLLRWQTPAADPHRTQAASTAQLTRSPILESSFRFSDPAEQQRFATAIAQLAGSNPTTPTHHTTLEDA